MTEQSWGLGPLWPLLGWTWTLALAATSPTDLASVSVTSGGAAGVPVEDGVNTTFTATSYNYTGFSCVSLLPPRRGSFYVEQGTGVSLGTVLAFWCREGYQLVGSEKISCILRGGAPQWSNYLPVCEAIPKPEDRGLRVAVLASVVSGIIILAMSVSFIICCLQERMSKERGSHRDSRSRKEKQRQLSRQSECWLEREEGDWDALPPPRIYHLSQRLDPHLPLNSPLYMGGLSGYDNGGYQRSQENLLKAPLPGLYHSESQVYPHMVLQRVPTPTAPIVPSAPSASVYLHLPIPPTDTSATQQVLPPYPKPLYHSPNSPPQ
ncbi:sushi domain-containing protein 3 [Chanos chanos]|uniref:Sushi domain-containing protein 3 n=1 Tax=Chanos chanos TaxID=29144 RepID=A0A6J2V2K5_CHACN|nr:sushi domain-containing protein 3-like [Chanos chanos]